MLSALFVRPTQLRCPPPLSGRQIASRFSISPPTPNRPPPFPAGERARTRLNLNNRHLLTFERAGATCSAARRRLPEAAHHERAVRHQKDGVGEPLRLGR